MQEGNASSLPMISMTSSFCTVRERNLVQRLEKLGYQVCLKALPPAA